MRLFHEESPRAFEPQKVEFGCTCSEERVRQSLSIYSAKDIEKMTTPEGRVTADCQFCGAHYDLSPKQLDFRQTKMENHKSRHITNIKSNLLKYGSCSSDFDLNPDMNLDQNSIFLKQVC